MNKFVIAVFIIFLGFVGYVVWQEYPQTENTVEDYAELVIRECASSNYTPLCYEEEIPKLMDRGLSMEETFEVVQIIQQEDQRLFYCHLLGHKISAKEAAKDLLNWTDVVLRAPRGLCSNGALHGAFQERFKDEVVTPDEYEQLVETLSGLCGDSPGRTFTDIERSSCYHAVGHLSMYIHQTDIEPATNLCSSIAVNDSYDYSRPCWDGIFMQIFQPVEPEDIALVAAIAPADALAAEEFCNSFSGEIRDSCVRESWPYFLEQIKEPDGIVTFCSRVTSERAVRACLNSVYYVLTAHFEFDQDRIEPVCLGLPESYRGQCYANVASRLLEIDYEFLEHSVSFCERAETAGVGERCWKELLFYSTFTANEGSERFAEFCSVLPEPWETRCVSGEGSTIDFFKL